MVFLSEISPNGYIVIQKLPLPLPIENYIGALVTMSGSLWSYQVPVDASLATLGIRHVPWIIALTKLPLEKFDSTADSEPSAVIGSAGEKPFFPPPEGRPDGATRR